jgi:response regulator RpfG family c-di-GMP phosphodiesterase/serine/threonine protein kinase
MNQDAVRDARDCFLLRQNDNDDALTVLDFCVQESLVHQEDWANLPQETRDEIEQMTEARDLLDRLVREKLLTQYQADRIEARTIHGLILGSYRVLDRLGAGGMGVVFLAEHMHLRRLVAIKMLPLYSGSDPGGPLRTRFFNEIRIIAQLQHPNIVWAIDTGEIAGDSPDAPVLYYHVMEYVPGKDLENLVLANGPLPIARACDLTYQIASALVEADKHNLVHRDIKPSNILVTPEGQAKLLDFGLARYAQNRHTQQGIVLGTIDYLAPEQARDASAVDIRADIYGLGATLFWALTGRVPFPSDAPLHQQIVQRLVQSPPKPSQVRFDVPPEVDAVLARMMATNPEHRYATPQAVMKALLPYLCSQSGDSIYLNTEDLARETEKRPSQSLSIPGATCHRVLVVDDDDLTRRVACHALRSEGFECEEAVDGLQALEFANERPFDLVLLDVELPALRGDGVLRKLRENPPRPNMKIVMASDRASVEEMSNMLLVGADDFLGKPFSVIQLIARVKSALRLKEAQDRTELLAQSLLTVNQQLEHNLRVRDSDLVDARNALTLAIAELVAYRGVETSAHLYRIQQYVRILASEAASLPFFAGKIDGAFIQMLEGTAPLHDVGMIGLPEYVFLKPGKLSDDERIQMRSHTTVGADILQKVARKHRSAATFLQMAVDITRHHHERWDGKGYPDRLADENIPLSARFVAIADVYDALRSRRPHKPALSHAASIEVITESSHGQFDPALVHVFQTCAGALEIVFKNNPD